MVTIYGLDERLVAVRGQVSDAIHGCMCSVLGLPEGKRAHRFMPVARENFYYPSGRSEAYTVIEIDMMAGRTEQTKKALIKALFAALEARAGITPNDVEITIREQPPHCWGFRGMTGDEAQLDYALKV